MPAHSDPHADSPVATDVTLDYVEFYVEDAEKYAFMLVDQYGFRVVARSPKDEEAQSSIAVRHGDIVLVVTQGLRECDPASEYIKRHGDGVANIALRTADAAATFADAVTRGAGPICAPRAFAGGRVAAVCAFGDTIHTLVERSGATGWCPPGLQFIEPEPTDELGLQELDHIAVCVEGGQLAGYVAAYETAFGFREIFEEHIVVGAQAMNSRVVQSASKTVTLTFLEPDSNFRPGQIDDFVDHHGGAGVQHLAFSSDNVLHSVGLLKERGVDFLTTPDVYYDRLPDRVDVTRYDRYSLRELSILVDVDHGGQLFQIFTRSHHPRRTLFFEVIERRGATTFGTGNIKALYEAVETDRVVAGDAD